MLFKRKHKKPIRVRDFKDYSIRLNCKAVVIFERLSGKSFFSFTEEDIALLLYSCFISSNDIAIDFTAFQILIEDNDVMSWLMNSYQEATILSSQFKATDEMKEAAEAVSKEEMPFFSDAIYALIAKGINPKWLMDEAELWQINSLSKAVETKEQSSLEIERLWTWLGILPHVDGNKLKTPEKLIEFPWEKEQRNKDAKKDLEVNKELINKILGAKLVSKDD